MASGATYALGADDAIGSVAGAGNVELSSHGLTAGGDNSTTSFSGVMSGTGSLSKEGSGTMTLSGANTYTGATNVNAGKLSVSGGLADTTAVTVALGAIYALGSDDAIGSLLEPAMLNCRAWANDGRIGNGCNLWWCDFGHRWINEDRKRAFRARWKKYIHRCYKCECWKVTKQHWRFESSAALSVASGATYGLDSDQEVASIEGDGRLDWRESAERRRSGSDTTFGG